MGLPRIRSLSLLSALLSLGCAAGGGADPECGVERGDEKNHGGEPEPSVVLVDIDLKAVEWARGTVSSLDGEPIGEPLPDKRFREVYYLINQAMAQLENPPASVAYAISFSPHEGRATKALAQSFDLAPFPVALQPDEAMDAGIYEQRRLGHWHTIGDPASHVWALPIDPDVDAFFVKRPLAVAAYANYLQVGRDMKANEATWRADKVAYELATMVVDGDLLESPLNVPEDLSPYKVPAIVLTDGGRPGSEANRISAVDLLKDPNEVASRLAGSVVIVGVSIDGRGTDLLGDGVWRSGMEAQYWGAQRLFVEGPNVPSGD